jgi:hypothetical protein
VDGILQDIRYGLRRLARAPGFAGTAALTLALGIGANAALFSLLDAALFKRLPVPETKRLRVRTVPRVLPSAAASGTTGRSPAENMTWWGW